MPEFEPFVFIHSVRHSQYKWTDLNNLSKKRKFSFKLQLKWSLIIQLKVYIFWFMFNEKLANIWLIKRLYTDKFVFKRRKNFLQNPKIALNMSLRIWHKYFDSKLIRDSFVYSNIEGYFQVKSDFWSVLKWTHRFFYVHTEQSFEKFDYFHSSDLNHCLLVQWFE
jgi:hypothetical protein